MSAAGRKVSPAVRRSLEGLGAGVVGGGLGAAVIAVSLLPQPLGPLALLALVAPFVLMLVGNVRKLLLAAIVFDISLQLDTHLFYRPETEALGAIGGLNLSVTTLCLLALYALWLAEALARRGPLAAAALRIPLAPALYLGFVALSLAVARDRALAGFELFLLLQMFLLYLYLASTVRSREEVRFLTSALFVSVAFQGGLIIATYLSGRSLEVAGISTAVHASYAASDHPRPGGTTGSPINAASFFGLLLAPALSVWLTSLPRRTKALAGLALGLGGVGLILTASRGGWMTVALSSALLLLLAWHRGWIPFRALLGAGVLTLLLVLPFLGAVIERLTGDDGGSARARGPLTALALHVIRDSPLLGVGANNFAVVLPSYVTPEFSREWLFVVHNKYLLVWAETGIGGLVSFLAFILFTLLLGWRCWRAGDRVLSPLALAFSAAILAQMIHMSVDVFHSRPQVQLLWFVAGLMAAMHALSEPQRASHAP